MTVENYLRVALLEDDPDQAEIISLWLKDAGYSVSAQLDSAGFLKTVRRDSFDLYLLDWIVPEMSGIAVLKKLRQEMKPIRRAELLARVSAILRRSGVGGAPEKIADVHPYEIDIKDQVVSLNGEEIPLTNREFGLAVLLFRNAGKLLSRSHILEAIWGMDNSNVSTRTVDTHASRLRKKLRLNNENGWKLTAVYQHGYRIEHENSQGKES